MKKTVGCGDPTAQNPTEIINFSIAVRNRSLTENNSQKSLEQIVSLFVVTMYKQNESIKK